MAAKQTISIWFFIGVLLTFYGILIFGVGIYDAIYPSSVHVVMEYMHAQIWWGAVLLLVGVMYVVKFRPGRG
jgi:hypothetical protein